MEKKKTVKEKMMTKEEIQMFKKQERGSMIRGYFNGCTALVKLGTLYLDQWTSCDYFPDIRPDLPVWVKVERK